MEIIAVSNYKHPPFDYKSGIGILVVVVVCLLDFVYLVCLFVYLITHFNKKKKNTRTKFDIISSFFLRFISCFFFFYTIKRNFFPITKKQISVDVDINIKKRKTIARKKM